MKKSKNISILKIKKDNGEIVEAILIKDIPQFLAYSRRKENKDLLLGSYLDTRTKTGEENYKSVSLSIGESHDDPKIRGYIG